MSNTLYVIVAIVFSALMTAAIASVRRPDQYQPCFMYRNTPRSDAPAKCFADFRPENQ